MGLELIRYAAAHAPVPFFAIGGWTRATSATHSTRARRGVRAARDRRRRGSRAHGARAARAARAERRGSLSVRWPTTASPRTGSEAPPPTSRRARRSCRWLGRAPAAAAPRGSRLRRARGAVLVGGLTVHDLAERGGWLPARSLLTGDPGAACRLGHVSPPLPRGARLRGAARVPDHRHLARAGHRAPTLPPPARACSRSASAGWLFWKLMRVMGRIQAGPISQDRHDLR